MLQKLLSLAKEEGGKAFVMNETTGEVFCVMPLETYREMKRGVTVIEKSPTESIESIASLSEEELLRKINREIAIWRDSQKDKAEIILPSREDRFSVPEIKSTTIKHQPTRPPASSPVGEVGREDFPKTENISFTQTAPVVKAPILETEEEFFLEMA